MNYVFFQLLEVQKHHQSTQTHINTQFWHPTWPCLIVNNTPISFLWIYMWPIFLTTQPYVKCSKIAKISKFKLQLLKKIIVKHLNPFKFSHCQQIPPLFFRRDSLTSYHLCNTRPMANVQLKVHSALPSFYYVKFWHLKNCWILHHKKVFFIKKLLETMKQELLCSTDTRSTI